jgi:hypothetical protein
MLCPASKAPRGASMGSRKMPSPPPSLQVTEAQLRRFTHPDQVAATTGCALGAIRLTLSELCVGTRAVIDNSSLADMIEAANSSFDGKRDAALFLVRCIGVPGAVPEGDQVGVGQQLPRKLVALFEHGAPDLVDFLRLNERKQTVEKYEVLRNVQRQCVEHLDIFRRLAADPAEFASRRQEIFRTLNTKFLKAYLNLYGFSDFSNSVRSVLNAICGLLEISDATFGQKLLDLFEQVDAEVGAIEARQDFLVFDAWLPFLRSARAILEQIEGEASERFSCVLRPRRAAPHVVERRYPLHEANRVVRVKVPLVNDGPGVAIDTTAQIIGGGDGVLISEDILDLGTVPPGEFSISFLITHEPQPISGADRA